jgi:AcrR family transcriptional regulator
MPSATARSSERSRQPAVRRPITVDTHPQPAGEPRRSRKGLETRARLLKAAKLVFERDGFLDARIVDIAETARLAPGSFYHYFDSKEQIFREVAEAQEERLTAPRDEEASDAGVPDSRWERIRRANRRYLERYRDEAALMGVIEQVSRYDEQVNAARMNTMKHFVERAERAIFSLQQEGTVDARLNPALAADALGAMVGRFAELWLVQGYRDYDFDDAVEQLTVLWANALGMPAESWVDVQPTKAAKKRAPGSRRAGREKKSTRA